MGLWDKGGRRNAPSQADDYEREQRLVEEHCDTMTLPELVRFIHGELPGLRVAAAEAAA